MSMTKLVDNIKRI